MHWLTWSDWVTGDEAQGKTSLRSHWPDFTLGRPNRLNLVVSATLVHSYPHLLIECTLCALIQCGQLHSPPSPLFHVSQCNCQIAIALLPVRMFPPCHLQDARDLSSCVLFVSEWPGGTRVESHFLLLLCHWWCLESPVTPVWQGEWTFV